MGQHPWSMILLFFITCTKFSPDRRSGGHTKCTIYSKRIDENENGFNSSSSDFG